MRYQECRIQGPWPAFEFSLNLNSSGRSVWENIMMCVHRLTAAVAFLAAALAPALCADKSIIVFDASGSMWAQIEGKTRIEIARETVRSVLGTLPADRELGLMAYGHREKGSCEDIELLVLPSPGSASAIIASTDKLNPKGKTPLSEAVKRAANELKYTEEKATVILVTDGIETCNADPCALGNELEKAGIDFTAHVVGFGLTEEEGKKVACLAENTGGKYFQASDAKSLGEALTTTVMKAPEPAPEPAPAPVAAEPEFNFTPDVIMAQGGASLGDHAGNRWDLHKADAEGGEGEYITTTYDRYKTSLEPGDYYVKASMGLASTAQKVTIKAGEMSSPLFVLNAGTVKIRPLASPGAEPSDAAAVIYKYPGGETTTYGPNTQFVPAGELTVIVKIGQGEASETFAVAAGQIVEKDIIAGTGHVVANAFYVEGMKVDSSGMFVEIFKATKRIDGTRQSIAYSYGPDAKFDLPAGDYALVAKTEGAVAETAFSVKVGERVEPNVILNAGVLKVTAAGYDGWQIFGAKLKIDGSREQFTYGYGPEFQATLIAGDYVIVTQKPGSSGQKETAVTVKAGERIEITVQ
jgi:Ca-activated chloride channel homolog